jgi:hypothetical protein
MDSWQMPLADVGPAGVDNGRRVKLYPLAQATNPPDTIFHDAIGVVYDTAIPYDLRYFQALDRVVQRDVWLTRDRVMIDQLKSIEIEKGKLFNPDESTRRILNAFASRALASGPLFAQPSRHEANRDRSS